MKRNILLNPGPATTTDSVKQAQVVPDICPREREFGAVMQGVSDDLLRIVHVDGSTHAATLFCGSGTLSMDVCLNSLLPADKKILVIDNGAYSARAVEICAAYHLSCIDLQFPTDSLPNLGTIEKVLKDNPDIAVVYTTHHETGSGLLNPIDMIGWLAHQSNAIFIVDTTSSFAMIPIDLSKEPIDFCMASAQKGIQAMTGLSFVIGRRDLIEASAYYPKRSYYCNLYLQYAYYQQTGQMHFTPPVQAIYAARQALKEYFIEGEQQKWQRHQRVSDAIHKGLQELGLQECIPLALQSGLVVSVEYPANASWDFDRVHDYCYENGFTIYPGKMQSKGTFRLCAFGAIDASDIERFFVVFRAALKVLEIESC